MSVSEAANGSVLHVGKAQAQLPLRQVRTVGTESITLAGGHSVGVVRASDGTREAAAVVVRRPNGAVDILWTGALYPSGDLGERRVETLEIGDRDRDGHPDIVVGTVAEGVRICGQERALLAPRALDPKSLTLRPVLLNRLDSERAVETVTASAQAPGLKAPPLLRALHPTAASSAVADAAGDDIRHVTDGDLSTYWAEGRGLGGRFEFLTFRWAAQDKPITALALVLPDAAVGEKLAPIRKVSISPERGPRLEVTLPEGAPAGQRYWIVPKAPLDATCLTLTLDDVPAVGPQVHGAIAELEAYTDLDRSGGIDALVAALIQDGPQAADATEWLTQTPADVVPQLSAAWPQLGPQAKRRAVRVVASRPDKDEHALSFLATAARDPDPETADDALAALVRELPRSHALLLRVAQSSGPAGDAAALALARSGTPDALRELLDIWAAEPSSVERAALREAVAEAFRRGGTNSAAVVERWLAQASPSIRARAAAGLALAPVPEAKASAARLVESSIDAGGEFPERWRLVKAAAQLPAHPATDAWLAQIVSSADEWMLRSAALEALEARHTAVALSAAKHALQDEYPRVRARAMHVLANDRDSAAALARHARKDDWFLVRAAALEALPDSASARATMRAALRDPSPIVRAAAIGGLRRLRDAEAWPAVRPLVTDADEFPAVIQEGIGYARALCLQASAETLQEVVKRGLRPEAWTADQELALSALEALTRLGGEPAKWALQRTAAPIVPPNIRAAAARAVDQASRCVVE